MVEEKQQTEEKKITNTIPEKQDEQKENQEQAKTNQNDIEKKDKKLKDSEEKQETKEELKKETGEPKIKKSEAVTNGKNLPISVKHSIAICNFIRGKDIDLAINELEEVVKLKKPIPMRGEIPHKKGIMSGRYPIKAAKEFIILLKGLKANALINEIELEKYKIACKANIASRPHRRFGRGRFKRTHATIKLIQRKKKTKEK